MIPYLTRRIFSSIVLLFVISALSYLLLSMAQIDVGRIQLGLAADQRQVDARNSALGLDRPIIVQYFDWLANALQGNLGKSWFTREDVGIAIANRLPVTLSLMLGVTAITAVASFLLGTWAAVRRGTVDRLVQSIGVLGYALPGFLVTLILVVIFAVQLRLFPAIGYVDFMVSPAGWLATITLPVISLSIGSIAGVSQQVRGSVIDALNQDYVRTLRARGLGPGRIVLGHVLRNASAPALTVLGMQFVGLLGGAVLVEQIFGLPGIGSMTVAYTVRGDVPIIMGLVMFTVVGVVVVNLLVDIAISWLNPKARLA